MKVDFSQGAYTARSVTADAQRQINLYAEPGSTDSSHKVSLYPTPGLLKVGDYTATLTGRCRGLYWGSDLKLYAVFGSSLVRIDQFWNYTLLGTIAADTGFPVSMVDNGITLFVVDGTPNGGWTYNISTSSTFAAVTAPAFYGSRRVDYIDTYFIFQKMGTQQFYISDSLATTFNPLYFAGKVGYSDRLVSIAALHDAVWLFGEVTTEIWFNSGAADFPFQRMPQSILQFGCFSTYTVIVVGNGVYWLSQDRQGHLMMLRGEGYKAEKVSNFAVEHEWSQYELDTGTVVSMAYQAQGHEFIVIQFTGAQNVTWVFDATTEFWHQRQTGTGPWLPSALAYFKAGGFGGQSLVNQVVAGDSSVAKLYTLDWGAYTDDGVAITRTRSWPHVLDDQKRVTHHQFVAAMSGTNLTPDDHISLRWSDDGGQTFGTPVVQTTNSASNGQYSWRRLGMARDRVYELSWTARGETALNGAWIEAEASGT